MISAVVDHSKHCERLAPALACQRLVVEGYPAHAICDANIKDYLSKLAARIGVVAQLVAATHRSERDDWAGWMHWETSGAHFYAWQRPVLFFSVDIYARKGFSVREAVEFTREYFNANRLSYKSC